VAAGPPPTSPSTTSTLAVDAPAARELNERHFGQQLAANRPLIGRRRTP